MQLAPALLPSCAKKATIVLLALTPRSPVLTASFVRVSVSAHLAAIAGLATTA